MNTTDHFSFFSKEYFFRRGAAYFILYLLILFTLCPISYGLFSAIPQMYSYIIPHYSGNNSVSEFSSIIDSFIPSAALLTVLFVSVFTAANRTVSALISAWYGASIGCAAALLSKGAIYGISDSPYFFAVSIIVQAVLTAALSSVSAVYSSAILCAHSCDEHRRFDLLCKEYLKLFLFLSGLIYLAVYVSVLLI